MAGLGYLDYDGLNTLLEKINDKGYVTSTSLSATLEDYIKDSDATANALSSTAGHRAPTTIYGVQKIVSSTNGDLSMVPDGTSIHVQMSYKNTFYNIGGSSETAFVIDGMDTDSDDDTLSGYEHNILIVNIGSTSKTVTIDISAFQGLGCSYIIYNNSLLAGDKAFSLDAYSAVQLKFIYYGNGATKVCSFTSIE